MVLDKSHYTTMLVRRAAYANSSALCTAFNLLKNQGQCLTRMRKFGGMLMEFNVLGFIDLIRQILFFLSTVE